jgi:hypothetical protein
MWKQVMVATQAVKTAFDTKPTHFSTAYQDGDPLSQDTDPSSASASPPLGMDGLPATQTLFFSEPDGAPALSYDEIHQGALGDCWVLSSFGEEALMNPAAIPRMIHSNGNGTETVTLYTSATGQLPTSSTTSYKPVNVLVNNASFSQVSVNGVDSISQDVIGDTQAIWPQVLENAFATLNGGYAAIGAGGNPMVALEEMTGMRAVSMQPGELTWANFVGALRSDDLMVFNTVASATALPDGLVGDHCYMLEGVSANGMLQLANPWGFNQPRAIAFSALQSVGVGSIDIGQQHQPG